jgi:hypothetical protein
MAADVEVDPATLSLYLEVGKLLLMRSLLEVPPVCLRQLWRNQPLAC